MAPQAVLSHSSSEHTRIHARMCTPSLTHTYTQTYTHIHTQGLTSLLDKRSNQSIFSCLWQCIHCMSAQSQGSDSAECLWLRLPSEGLFCQTALWTNTGEVSFWFPVVWNRSQSCVLYQMSKANTRRRSSSIHDTLEAMKASSLLNIDWGSQTMGERNLCYSTALLSLPLSLYCKKKCPSLCFWVQLPVVH